MGYSRCALFLDFPFDPGQPNLLERLQSYLFIEPEALDWNVSWER